MDIERAQSHPRNFLHTAGWQLAVAGDQRKYAAELRKRAAELRKRVAEADSALDRTSAYAQITSARDGIEKSRADLQRINATLSYAIHPYTDHLAAAAALPAITDASDRREPSTQRAAYVLRPPSGPQWVHELNHNGRRLMCRREGRKVTIRDAYGREQSASFPSLVAALLKLDVENIRLDGVAVVLDEIGVSACERIDDAIDRGDDSDVLYLAFDLLWLNGEGLSDLPLLERKRRLRRALGNVTTGKIGYAGHLRQDGAKVLQQAALLGLEGIVSKRANAPYRVGLGLDWQLTRCPRLRWSNN